MMKANKPQLTISLLISNRIETIPRCLDSLCSIMEAIHCELILTDTSKNPEIRKLLLKYTNQVYEFEWCNDFAKARNLGLEKANGEWFMFLDDDEWFGDATDIIEFFQSREYQNYGCATYKVRNFLDKSFSYYEDGCVSRLVRRDKDTRFIGKVHEDFVPIKGACKELQAMVYHTGYIYETEAERKAHFERNRILLLDMINDEPQNIRLWVQLVQEYSYSGEQKKLIDYCSYCLEQLKMMDDPYANNQVGVFYTALTTGYIRTKEYEKCLKITEEAFADCRSNRVLDAMMHLKRGEALLHLGKVEDSRDEICKYFHILKDIDFEEANVKRYLGAVLVGKAFDRNSQEIAYAILISCGLLKGDISILEKYYNKLGWSGTVVYTMEGVEKYIVKALFTLDYHPIYLQIITDVLNKANLREAFRKEILLYNYKETLPFQKNLSGLVRFMQVVIDGPSNDLLKYQNDLQLYVQAACEWYDFLEQENALELLGKEMPCYLQAAMCLSDYLEMESKDKQVAFRSLKDAVELLPEFAEGIGEFLGLYSELEKQRELSKRQEMDALRAQIIMQVEAMIHCGQKDEAYQIIEQLKTVFKDDEEILALLNKIEG